MHGIIWHSRDDREQANIDVQNLTADAYIGTVTVTQETAQASVNTLASVADSSCGYRRQRQCLQSARQLICVSCLSSSTRQFHKDSTVTQQRPQLPKFMLTRPMSIPQPLCSMAK